MAELRPVAVGRDAPAFLVTIDTEGDNLWARPRRITTHNAAYVQRFQRLCESFGLRPSWLTNHEMACCPRFQAFGRDVLRRGAGEIGMHLHAWNSPPLVPLTHDDMRAQPFLTEYSAEVVEAKVAHMAQLLRERFECEIVSHRGGRWALDATCAQALVRHGIRVDCSVTPDVRWLRKPLTAAEPAAAVADRPARLMDEQGQRNPSHPRHPVLPPAPPADLAEQARPAPPTPQDKGAEVDYRGYPLMPYVMDLAEPRQPGFSALLEVPMTVVPSALYRRLPQAYRVPVLRRWSWAWQPTHHWLYPDGRNLESMLHIVRQAVAQRWPHLEMVLHSSELMPGGSPSFPDGTAIEALYRDLQVLFRSVAPHFRGMTLGEFARQWPSAAAQAGASGLYPSAPSVVMGVQA